MFLVIGTHLHADDLSVYCNSNDVCSRSLRRYEILMISTFSILKQEAQLILITWLSNMILKVRLSGTGNYNAPKL